MPQTANCHKAKPEVQAQLAARFDVVVVRVTRHSPSMSEGASPTDGHMDKARSCDVCRTRRVMPAPVVDGRYKPDRRLVTSAGQANVPLGQKTKPFQEFAPRCLFMLPLE